MRSEGGAGAGERGLRAGQGGCGRGGREGGSRRRVRGRDRTRGGERGAGAGGGGKGAGGAGLGADPSVSPPALSRPHVCPGLSAGLAPPWTVAASPTCSSPRLPCRLSGPLVTGPAPPPPTPQAFPLLPLPPGSLSESPEPNPFMKNLARNFTARCPCHLPAGCEGLWEGG